MRSSRDSLRDGGGGGGGGVGSGLSTSASPAASVAGRKDSYGGSVGSQASQVITTSFNLVWPSFS